MKICQTRILDSHWLIKFEFSLAVSPRVQYISCRLVYYNIKYSLIYNAWNCNISLKNWQFRIEILLSKVFSRSIRISISKVKEGWGHLLSLRLKIKTTCLSKYNLQMLDMNHRLWVMLKQILLWFCTILKWRFCRSRVNNQTLHEIIYNSLKWVDNVVYICNFLCLYSQNHRQIKNVRIAGVRTFFKNLCE